MSAQERIDVQTSLFTRITNSMENLRKLGPAKITIGQVETRMKTLEANWKKFQTNHDALQTMTNQLTDAQRRDIHEMPYFANDLLTDCEEQYNDNMATMVDLLRSLQAEVSALTPNPPTAQTETSNSATSNANSKKLPRIALPHYSGGFSGWKHFRDLFSSMVIQNSGLSQVEKLHYLNSCLSGEALQRIKNISIADENFDRAWETLTSRYENKRRLADAHFSAFFGIERVTRKSAKDLTRLYNNAHESLGALESLGVKSWDYLAAHVIIQKLDPDSLEEWEKRVSESTEPHTFSDLESFLIGRISTLEGVEEKHPVSIKEKGLASSSKVKPAIKAHSAQNQKPICQCCAEEHFTTQCPELRGKSVSDRNEVVNRKRLCYNCLGAHPFKECRSKGRCRNCNGRHHTLLHKAQPSETIAHQSTSSVPAASSSTDLSPDGRISSHTARPGLIRQSSVLLPTALVNVEHTEVGRSLIARALLDQGSETTFVSEELVQKLRLPRRHATIPVTGVGAQQSGMTRGLAIVTMKSRVNPSVSLDVEALVLPKLTGFLPTHQHVAENWPHLDGIPLADPSFNCPSKVDLILGVEIYQRVLLPGLRKGTAHSPIAQETTLGWILSGVASSQGTSAPQHAIVECFQGTLDHELLELMQRFWKQKEAPTTATLSPENDLCEQHFRRTVSRDESGRYVVRLPIKDRSLELGDSYTPAQSALWRIERRFAKDINLKNEYAEFLRQYQQLGHMRHAEGTAQGSQTPFYLPHHGVIRETSTTTKLRVVFNGSQKTDLGRSLNENLFVGPKTQNDLADVLLRWRQHAVTISCDIVKMYRQIRVHQDDWDFQRILWRPDSQSSVREYQLCTVTYGLACAPYLAIRVLQQLIQDEGEQYPRASNALAEHAYVDDILSGADDVSQCRELIRQLQELLKAGGFELQKWTSSDPRAFNEISPDHLEKAKLFTFDQSPFFRTLGLAWKSTSDTFTFSPPPLSKSARYTKRIVLSHIAQLFDPLGWLAPIVIKAKIFMQELWTHKFGWDERLPDPLAARWNVFLQELQNISKITVPRWIGLKSTPQVVELHGFSDASQHALGAVLYLRVTSTDGSVKVSLLCAKSKVTPLKKVTIPRLELCAAVILVRLARHVIKTLHLNRSQVHLWTDSTVVLSWTNSHPSRWKEFVRNRVTEIHDFPQAQWHHVPGDDNPADLASRGASPEQVRNSPLWITGPSWLTQPPNSWPTTTPLSEPASCREEQRTILVNFAAQQNPPMWDLVERYSKLTKLIRVTAMCQRASGRFKQLIRSSEPNDHSGAMSTLELEQARIFWIKATQKAYFEDSIRLLSQGSELPRSHPFSRLTPFTDSRGLLRVGGRLQRSSLPFDEQHPMILPRASTLTSLVIDHYHRLSLHGGPQLTLSTIRQQFWIIGGRAPIKSLIQNTSAVHLELVSDLSSEAFIAAYKRFTARRGICATLSSDCGRNLIGADAELQRLLTASCKESAEIADSLASLGTQWRFNPPSTPHFGGKWEAGVKSVKYHLKRVIGTTLLTFEEFTTLLAQIEATLNSRPLWALSDDPSDLNALTPGHFLIGAALNAIPEPSLSHLPTQRLSHWQRAQQMLEEFWSRWKKEYLQSLQARSKWQQQQENIKVGSIVLIKNDNLPPAVWLLARVIDVHPGADGLVRVATVKTKTSTLKRPIAKLCVLPVKPST